MQLHDTIVRARLAPSDLPGTRLRRQRLMDRLLAHPHARLVVIEGPAGSGKTVLVRDAVAELGGPTAWYSVEPSERDPAVFVAWLLEAVGRVAPAVAHRARLAWDGAGDVGAVLTPLLNALCEHDGTVRLVLDDIHQVASEPALRTWLRGLAEQAPANLQLWLLTRVPLRLGLGRLLARGHMLRVEASELALTGDETEALMRDVWRWPPNPQLAEELHRATGGWITGLQLLHRQAGPDTVRAAMQSAASAGSAMYEYLAEQVLNALPTRQQDLLLETSLADPVDADLAEVVTGDPEAVAGLENAVQRGLFVYEHEGTFRYHHLFGGFLRQALQQKCGVSAWRDRHARLASHFADQDPLRALHHAVEGHAWLDAVALLERHGDALLRAGYTDRVGSWLARLPGRLRESSPALRLQSAMVAERRGDGARALTMYQQLLSTAARDMQAVLLERMLACLMRFGDMAGAARCAEQGLALCPPGDLGLQSRMLSWQAAASLIQGQDIEEAAETVRRAHSMALRSGDPMAVWAAAVVLGFGAHGQFGNLDQGVDGLSEGARLLVEMGCPAQAAHLLVNRAMLLTLTGSFEQATAGFDQVDALSHGDAWVEAALLASRAFLAVDRRNLAAAEPLLDRLSGMSIPLQVRPWAIRTQVVYHALRGEFEKAERLGLEMMEALRLLGSRGMYAPACHLALARLHAGQGRVAAALCQAEEALGLSQAIGSPIWEARSRVRVAELKGEATRHPSAELEIFTLGRFAVFRQGKDLTAQVCRRGKACDLLKLLLASPAFTLSVEMALECLWPGTDPARARQGLATQVSLLRRHLGPSVVGYQGQAYQLSLDEVRVDLVDLLDWLEQTRTALQQGNLVAAARVCRWAGDLYRGPFLPDDLQQDWLAACRLRLREQYHETVQAVARAQPN